jgi:hypothetical protein
MSLNTNVVAQIICNLSEFRAYHMWRLMWAHQDVCPGIPEGRGILPLEDEMRIFRIAMPLMAVALMGAPLLATAQNSNTQSAQSQDWNTPPAGTEQAQQGYKDGIEAAKLDKAAKRKIDAKSSHLYKNPPVKGAAKDEYRASFEKGYQAQVQHND